MARIICGSVQIVGNGASPQRLSDESALAKHITVQALPTNGGSVAVGDGAVNLSTPQAGIFVPTNSCNLNGETAVSPNAVFVRGNNSGDTVLWTAVVDS